MCLVCAMCGGAGKFHLEVSPERSAGSSAQVRPRSSLQKRCAGSVPAKMRTPSREPGARKTVDVLLAQAVDRGAPRCGRRPTLAKIEPWFTPAKIVPLSGSMRRA